jgi:NADH:ubiquinone oxidoreductase subunit F (NADH-binding)/ferredoxin
MTFEQIQRNAIEQWKTEKNDLPAYPLQQRVVLRNCGLISPEDIQQYIASNGYSGFARALKLGPAGVLAEMATSKLRGRGGAGFPVIKKWRICYETPQDEKVIICNATEGDPTVHITRFLLEGDPHSILEGLLIGGFAVGAKIGYIVVNQENTLAVKRLNVAVEQMKGLGLLGNHILDSDFCFQVEIKTVDNGFLSGEETALIRALEGKLAMPYNRPPYPAVSGLDGKPTLVNSAETLANVTLILQNGADWFGQIGTENSKGTKLFSLSGDVVSPGIIEVPMGTTLHQIIYEIGGGLQDGISLKSLFIGGPTGGFLPESSLATAVDYEAFADANVIMGSGSIVALNINTCMVEYVLGCMSFAHNASCGKCVLCREGTSQLQCIHADITEGNGKPDDIELLLELAEGIHAGSLCNLGKTAALPILTVMEHFRDEYEMHIRKKRCPALVCKSFITYHILPKQCQGCGVCLTHCPADAIEGGEQMIHVIDQSECTKCGICLDVCPAEYHAVTIAGGVKPKVPDEPIPVGSWKRK